MLDKNGFNSWAGNFDKSIKSDLDSFPFDGYYDVFSVVISIVKPKNNLKIMDVGIGTGLLSEELHKKGCNIYGIDFSKKMLEISKKRIPRGDFEIVDVATNHFGKFNNYVFDRVISSYFFHHLNYQQQISFIKRTKENNLSTDGKIIIADIGFKNEDDLNKCHIGNNNKWDESENYMIGDSIVSSLQSENINAKYKQISSCAGVLIVA